MPVFFDIAAKDFKSFKKGDILTISASACSDDPSGRMVGFEITDATIEQVLHYVHEWPLDFSHTVNNENAFGWQFIIEVDPAYISASDVGKASIKADMQTHIENSSEYWEGSAVVSFSPNSMTVNIPKNGVYQTAHGLSDIDYLKLLKKDFSDIFKTTVLPKRYHFSATDVDTVIAAGGFIQITKAQALNKVLDKLDE